MSGTRLDPASDEEARWSEWMARAQDGDPRVYETLMTQLGGAIEQFLLRRFGSVGASDFVEECVQESLLAIHRARHSYDPRRPFRPWLLTIVRHKAIDLLRRGRLRLHAPLPDDPAAVSSDLSERLDAVTLLHRLEPMYREALILTKLQGHSLEEAAARSGVSVSAMKTRVHRAMRALRDGLFADDPG